MWLCCISLCAFALPLLVAISAYLRVSLLAQLVKNPPAMWESWVRALGWEEPLEKGKATHANILAGKILWTEDTGGLRSMQSQS